MNLLHDILVVALGGALGAVTRFGVTRIGIFENNPYLYTVAINLTGCLIVGIIWALLNHFDAGRIWYLFLITGFLGGYTTYSAFTMDAILQFDFGRIDIALIYVALTVVGGLGCCALSFWGTRKILSLLAS